ncbi:hypothetical protein Dip510_001340 [Elusimicrobium posterum]|uniref:hypothetical protein n=1 Tax=Elusimicrobium posterum TaxID=3116653 RepID=UPI003C776BAE
MKKIILLITMVLACNAFTHSKELPAYIFSENEITGLRNNICSNMNAKGYDCDSLSEIQISDMCQKKNVDTHSILKQIFPLLEFDTYRERCSDSISSWAPDIPKGCKSLSKNEPKQKEVVFNCQKLNKRYADPEDKEREILTITTTSFFPVKLKKDTFEARKQLALYIFSISGIERNLIEMSEENLKKEWKENTGEVKNLDLKPSFKVLDNNTIEVKVVDYSRCPSSLAYITTKIYADTKSISVISKDKEIIVDMKINTCVI